MKQFCAAIKYFSWVNSREKFFWNMCPSICSCTCMTEPLLQLRVILYIYIFICICKTIHVLMNKLVSPLSLSYYRYVAWIRYMNPTYYICIIVCYDIYYLRNCRSHIQSQTMGRHQIINRNLQPNQQLFPPSLIVYFSYLVS